MSRDRAAEVVGIVAERTADPETVAGIAADTVDRQAGGMTTAAWLPGSLADGHPGLALLHAELGDRPAAHAHLVAANRAASGPGHRLYADRLPGLLLAALASAGRPGDYATVIGQARPAVAARVRRTAEAELDRIADGGSGTRFAAYDVLSGLTGATRLLLLDATATESADLAGEGLRALVALAGPGRDHEVPGWLVEHGWDDPGESLPHLNLGLAHGVPGPLAVLSIAYRDGLRVPGQAEAIERIAGWLVAQGDGVRWPEIVAPDGTALVPAGRPGWCYGVPGSARALYLAGAALDVPAWRETAVRALLAALADPWDGFGMGEAGLCHGWGGLLQITLRMGWDSGDERLLDAAEALAGRALGYFAAGAPFGFRYVAGGRVRMAADRPGFLWGAAGATLALHAAATGRPPRTCWDAALLLT